jgi:hypothetical protein
MLTHRRMPVCLSFLSLETPLWSTVETSANLYQKERDRFHLLLTEPPVLDPLDQPSQPSESATPDQPQPPRLLWLELSPYRVVMTMQGNGKFSYRHFWEQGVYGLSRYWLQSENLTEQNQLRLRNYTRSLTLSGQEVPDHLRVEYELWSSNLRLGRYVLNVEIQH